MAMPANFWRDDQKLDIFKTKPCQRLLADGTCKWRSRCQYSHCPDWPRRQPRKYRYSPEICPQVQIVQDESGVEQAKNLCIDKKCTKAHSKEEVLFHPLIFKTTMCDEYMQNIGMKKGQGAKRSRCHRFYCPFAHGNSELRTSSMADEQRDACLRSVDLFPSDTCCNVCTPYSCMPAACIPAGPPGLELPPGLENLGEETYEGFDLGDSVEASLMANPAFSWLGQQGLPPPVPLRLSEAFPEEPNSTSQVQHTVPSVLEQNSDTPLTVKDVYAFFEKLDDIKLPEDTDVYLDHHSPFPESTYSLWGDVPGPVFLNLFGDEILSPTSKESLSQSLPQSMEPRRVHTII